MSVLSLFGCLSDYMHAAHESYYDIAVSCNPYILVVFRSTQNANFQQIADSNREVANWHTTDVTGIPGPASSCGRADISVSGHWR